MNQLDRITIAPNICCGQPTIRGSRITVSLILKLIANGAATQDIIKSYPELKPDDISQTLKDAAWLASENTRRFDGTSKHQNHNDKSSKI